VALLSCPLALLVGQVEAARCGCERVTRQAATDCGVRVGESLDSSCAHRHGAAAAGARVGERLEGLLGAARLRGGAAGGRRADVWKTGNRTGTGVRRGRRIDCGGRGPGGRN
jgi:hypothetical protein